MISCATKASTNGTFSGKLCGISHLPCAKLLHRRALRLDPLLAETAIVHRAEQPGAYGRSDHDEEVQCGRQKCHRPLQDFSNCDDVTVFAPRVIRVVREASVQKVQLRGSVQTAVRLISLSSSSRVTGTLYSAS